MARGEKFTEKYKVDTATIYKAKGDTDALKIPGPGHVLYDPTAPKKFDPIRVKAIDRDGKMTTPIEVWTDPDSGTLWVLDGRGRTLDVREVNRRRAAEGRELVQPYIVPFSGDEAAAVARVREKNYHRRLPTVSGMAMDLLALRNHGCSWEACAEALHVEVDAPEQWGRKILPLAFCIPEVQAAVDAGEIPRGAARKFSGGKPDGSARLGDKEQEKLLAEMLEKKPEKKGSTHIGAKGKERAAAALTNGASEGLRGIDQVVARAVAGTIARLAGDKDALKSWPKVAAILDEAVKPLPAGRPKKVEE